MSKRYENVWEVYEEVVRGSNMQKVVKWTSMVVSIGMAVAAVWHGLPEFGWIASVFIAVAGGEEVAEIIQQTRGR